MKSGTKGRSAHKPAAIRRSRRTIIKEPDHAKLACLAVIETMGRNADLRNKVPELVCIKWRIATFRDCDVGRQPFTNGEWS